MVSIEGVDYSYSRPGGAALKAKGKKFAVRYITNPGPGAKGISQSEFNDLRNHGLTVPVVWEGGAGDMLKGHAQGVADAKQAQANLKKIVGLPDRAPVYFACDFDASPAQQTAINAYLDGAASVLGRERVGIYGGYYPVKRARDAKKATWLWQTYAWSGGQILDGLHLYQYKNGQNLNGAVDYCRALKSEYGQSNVPDPAAAAAAAAAAKAAAEKAAADKAAADKAAADKANASNEAAIVAAANANLGAFPGMYFIKSPDNTAIYVYNPVTGTKRLTLGAEWRIIKAFKHDVVVLLTQADVDKIPTAS